MSCSGLTLEQLTNDFYYAKYFNTVHSGEIQIGNGDSEIDTTLERCVQSMHSGEVAEATLRTKFDLARNRRGPSPGDSKNDIWVEINCKIHLESLLNAQPIYKWYPETKLD